MKFTVKFLAVLWLLLASFSPQGSASAEVNRFTGHDDTAIFESMDASGCIQTLVGIETGAEYLNSISVVQHDRCQGQLIMEAYGNKPLTKSEIHYTGKLGSTTLKTTVQLTDFERSLTFDVWVDLKWTGIGVINEYHQHQNYRPFPGCHINQQLWGQYRSASVSGTVSDGTMNFTPQTTTSADMQFTKTISTSQGCE